MGNNMDADFTQKELCLLLQTICEEELGVIVRKDIKAVRKDVDVFSDNDEITVKRLRNKQGTTRVSVFKINYGVDGTAYTTTL